MEIMAAGAPYTVPALTHFNGKVLKILESCRKRNVRIAWEPLCLGRAAGWTTGSGVLELRRIQIEEKQRCGRRLFMGQRNFIGSLLPG